MTRKGYAERPKGAMKLYNSYMFRDKDPVIDQLRGIYQSAAKVNHRTFRLVEEMGGPSITAQAGWFFGKVRRPQSASVEAAGRALGWKREWVEDTGKSAKAKARLAIEKKNGNGKK